MEWIQMNRLFPLRAVDSIENSAMLDPIITKVRGAVELIIRPQWLRDVLHGVPIGHPLHPLLAQVPLGAWTSAAVLDLVPGTERAARILVAAGVVGAVPTAAAGYTDWSRLHVQQQRVGVVHSTANLLATSLYAASLVQRLRGNHSNGKALGYVAFLIAATGGFLGGHLAYRQGSGVNHTADVPHRIPPGWHALARMDELPDRELDRRLLFDVPVLVFRHGDEVNVLSDVCSHLSGPLHEGKLLAGDDPCVVCPWHGSTFNLSTGEVVHGPATTAQPRFRTRVVNGVLEVDLPGAS
jgi:nitrite reductase/ring-hydroxylating ferredoxin subunit/uncharacterized membrane protein